MLVDVIVFVWAVFCLFAGITVGKITCENPEYTLFPKKWRIPYSILVAALYFVSGIEIVQAMIR